jgi:hypothetical protein
VEEEGVQLLAQLQQQVQEVQVEVEQDLHQQVEHQEQLILEEVVVEPLEIHLVLLNQEELEDQV